MSIPVELDRLAEALTEFGAGYLLTASADGRVKVLTVDPDVREGTVVVSGPSKGSAANIAANPRVTLVFPPPQPKGFSLIVDGVAEAVGDDFRVRPSAAVLHRPSSHSDGPPPPDGCGHDCRPV